MPRSTLINGWVIRKAPHIDNLGVSRWCTVDHRLSFAFSQDSQQWSIIPWNSHDARALDDAGILRTQTDLSLRQCVRVCSELIGSSVSIRQINTRYEIMSTPFSLRRPLGSLRTWHITPHINAENVDVFPWVNVMSWLQGRQFKNLDAALAAFNRYGYQCEGYKWSERLQQSVANDAILEQELISRIGE